jgi:hypothetical protein
MQHRTAAKEVSFYVRSWRSDVKNYVEKADK